MDKCMSHKIEKPTSAEDNAVVFKKEAASQTDNKDWAAVKQQAFGKTSTKDFGDLELYDTNTEKVKQVPSKNDYKCGDKADQKFEK